MEKNATDQEKYKFLSNEPLGIDTFKSKSQEKIAHVIKEKIINDKNFSIIGIDGDWGSGKSNLVKLTEEELKGTHKFFIYDVWGHQEDEQRRAILEELTRFINSEQLTKSNDKEKWEKRQESLLAKVKLTKTRKKPVLSLGIILSLLALLIIPITNAVGNDINSWVRYILYSLPVLVILLAYLSFVIKYRKQKSPWKLACLKLFELYNRDKLEETFSEIVSEKKPSVKEFRHWMKDIDKDLEKEIVIVFDNFDRLPRKHILSVWSSIHIFFTKQPYETEQPYQKIKVILPFDRAHIQNAFKELNADKSKNDSDRKIVPDFGDDYINKTFDIVFRIPSPIMSDWKEFFRSKWEKAFKKNTSELEDVIHIYEFLSNRKTPREIIAFINEILTIKLINEDYKERYIAIFVLSKQRICGDPLGSITNLDYLSGLKSKYKFDEEFSKQLTAITYNLEVDKADELIYRQELRESLNNNDFKKFEKISKAVFFRNIFYSTIPQLEIFQNPIRLLDQVENSLKDFPIDLTNAWQSIYDKVNSKKTDKNNIVLEDWEMILLKHAPNNNYLANIFIGLSKLIKQGGSTKDLVNQLEELPEELNGESIFDFLQEVEVESDKFLDVITLKGSDYKKYKITGDDDKLDNYLKELEVDKLSLINNTDVLFKNFELPKYIERLKNDLSGNKKVEDCEVLLLTLKESIPENRKLKDLLNDQRIHSLFDSCKDRDDLQIKYDLIALRILKGSRFNSQYAGPFNSILNSEEDKLTDGVSNVILDYIDYPDLLLKAIKFIPKSALFKKVILNLINSDRIKTEEFDLSEIIYKDKYSQIKDVLDIESNVLLGNFSLGEPNFNNSISDFKLIDNEFIKDCFANRTEDILVVNKFILGFDETFRGLTKDEYEEIFDDSDSPFIRYFNEIKDDSLTQQSMEVFGNRFKEKFNTDSLNDKWWRIFEKYDSSEKLSVRDMLASIRDDIRNSRHSLTVEQALRISPYFLEHNILNDKKEVFRTIIKNEFLEDENFVKFLIDNESKIKEIYSSSPGEGKKGFRNTINEQKENNENIDKLAGLIDIRRSKKDN